MFSYLSSLLSSNEDKTQNEIVTNNELELQRLPIEKNLFVLNLKNEIKSIEQEPFDVYEKRDCKGELIKDLYKQINECYWLGNDIQSFIRNNVTVHSSKYTIDVIPLNYFVTYRESDCGACLQVIVYISIDSYFVYNFRNDTCRINTNEYCLYDNDMLQCVSTLNSAQKRNVLNIKLLESTNTQDINIIKQKLHDKDKKERINKLQVMILREEDVYTNLKEENTVNAYDDDDLYSHTNDVNDENDVNDLEDSSSEDILRECCNFSIVFQKIKNLFD